MNIKDRVSLGPIGGVLVIVHRKDGTEERHYTPNVVTTRGRECGISHWANSATEKTLFTHLGIGSGVSVASTEDRALSSETYRVELDQVYGSGVTLFGYAEITAIDLSEDAVVIRELGLLDAESGGNLICRQVLAESISIQEEERAEILWGVSLI